MTRRDYGTGSITPRGPDRWQLRWYSQPDPIDGSRRRRTETFTGTRKAALARLRDRTLDPSKGTDGHTVADAIRLWRLEADHTPGHARNYDLSLTVIPAPFLATPLSKVRAPDIKTVVAHIVRAHNVHRARNVQALISGALQWAAEEEMIPTNPARKVRYPPQPARQHTTPTTEDVQALLAAVAQDPQYLAWLMVSAVVGTRPGEARALHWSDIDLDTGRVSISKAIDPITGVEKATKTETVRVAAIGPATITALQEWRWAYLERLGMLGRVRPPDDPYVFCADELGRQPWSRHQANHRFRKARTAAGVTCREYDLRHYVATTALASGVPVRDVAGRMGHTRVQTTTDTYGHALPAGDAAIATLIEHGLTPRG